VTADLRGLILDVGGPVLAEVFVVRAAEDQLLLTGPCGAAPWHLEVAAGDDPMPVVREVVGRVLGPPLLLHSTSWRRDKGAVMLSFLAVVRADQVDRLAAAPVVRTELARNTADAAPEQVAYQQVLEHALRHLAWLVEDDPVVSETLDETWRRHLAPYVPEPFRVLS
jgi:hypothetical protein